MIRMQDDIHTESQRHGGFCDVCKVLDSEYGRKGEPLFTVGAGHSALPLRLYIG